MDGNDRLFAHIGAIYDAALDAKRWPAVLTDLAAMFGGTGAVLEGNDRRSRHFAQFWCAGVPAALSRDYQAHYMDNPRVRFGARLRTPSILHEPMFITEREMDRDPYYADLLARYDLRYALAAVIHNTPMVTTGVAVQRPKRAGPPAADEIARFAPLAPHYRRALLIHAGLQRADGRERALLGTLEHLAAAVLLVGAGGRVMLANGAADRLLAAQDGLSSRPEGLAGRDVATTRALRRAIACAATAPEGATLRLPRAGGPPLVAQVFPVRGDTASWFGLSGPAAAIMIADPRERPAIDVDALALALGVTRQDAALAAALARGASLAEAAAATTSSLAASRKRLYRLFDKLGVRRQQDLVRLVLAAAFPR